MPDAIVTLEDVGDQLFEGFGTLAVVVVLIPGAVLIMGINLYGSMLSGLSIVQDSTSRPKMPQSNGARSPWTVQMPP